VSINIQPKNFINCHCHILPVKHKLSQSVSVWLLQ